MPIVSHDTLGIYHLEWLNEARRYNHTIYNYHNDFAKPISDGFKYGIHVLFSAYTLNIKHWIITPELFNVNSFPEMQSHSMVNKECVTSMDYELLLLLHLLHLYHHKSIININKQTVDGSIK